MYPAYKHGQIVLVSMIRNYKVNDVVVALQDNREVMKRVAEVKSGSYSLLGDNKDASTDSRTHGWLPDRQILAKVVFPKVRLK